ETIAKAIWSGHDIEGLGFLKQFVSSIIDIEHRKFDAGRLAHFHGACAPESMDRGSTEIFSNDREQVSPRARDRRGHFQDRAHLLFVVNESMRNLTPVFGRILDRIALINSL